MFKAKDERITTSEIVTKFLRKSKDCKATRRQDVPKVWELNGAIYVINPKSIQSKPIGNFQKVIKYEMDQYSSHDIDSLLDWQVAEEILKSFL